MNRNLESLQEMKLEREEKRHREDLVRKSRAMRQLLGLSDASSNAVLVNNINMVWSALQGNGVLELYLLHKEFWLKEVKDLLKPHFLHLYEIYQSFSKSKDCSMDFYEVVDMFHTLGFTFVSKHKELTGRLYLESLLINKDSFSFYHPPSPEELVRKFNQDNHNSGNGRKGSSREREGNKKRGSNSSHSGGGSRGLSDSVRKGSRETRDTINNYNNNEGDTKATRTSSRTSTTSLTNIPSYTYNNIEIPSHVTVKDCPTAFTFPNFLIMLIHVCVTKYIDFAISTRMPNIFYI